MLWLAMAHSTVGESHLAIVRLFSYKYSGLTLLYLNLTYRVRHNGQDSDDDDSLYLLHPISLGPRVNTTTTSIFMLLQTTYYITLGKMS
jgi:hypothetical protein